MSLAKILSIKSFVQEVSRRSPFEKLGGIDFGSKNTGIAVSDETKQYTFPYGTFTIKQPHTSVESIIDFHRQLQEFSAKEDIR